MAEISKGKRIWGWYFFDWASQPYNTLILTFIFGPYFALVASESLVSQGMDPTAASAQAQAYWGYGLTATGILIAVMAPILGAISDNTGRKMPWIWVFSVMYFVGSFGLWWAAPDNFSVVTVLVLFGVGLIGMEFATIFTNAYLPSLSHKDDLARVSGTGWAFGYVGGVGPAPYDEPRGNLTGDPYFTDGRRVVMWIADDARGLDEIEFVDLSPYATGVIGP